MNKLIERLGEIQQQLKAPKNQYNSFGKYIYRSCEDIMEAVKPLLNGLVLNLTDEVKEAAGCMYVEATAMITDGNKVQAVKAQAGIDINRKGMDIAQSFGSSSSSARKYALNGVFLIDDTNAQTGPFVAVTALSSAIIDVSECDVSFIEHRDSSGDADALPATITIPTGVTIYGRFESIELDDGSVLAYRG